MRVFTAVLAIAAFATSLGFGDANPSKTRNVLSIIACKNPVEHVQPDGTVAVTRMFGDARYSYLETLDGYTVQLNQKTGFYEYVKRGPDGKFRLTGLIVGKNDPAITGLDKHVREAPEIVKESIGASAPEAVPPGPTKNGYFPSSGVLPALVIPAYWNDDDDTTATVSRDELDTLFNDSASTAKSVYNYYKTVSYGAVDFLFIVHEWIELPEDQTVYATNPEQAVTDAIDILMQEDETTSFPGSVFDPFDIDGDGILEPVIIVHQGFGREETQNPNDIHSHFSWLDPPYDVDTSASAEVSDKQVVEHLIVPELLYDRGNDGGIITAGVICHELGHAFGLPDLYYQDFQGNTGSAVGSWALMDYGPYNQVDRVGDTPAEMIAWSRRQLGWVDPPSVPNGMQIIVPTLGAELPFLEINPFALVIPQDVGVRDGGFTFEPSSPTVQYLLMENRFPINFDEALPGPGMLLYRINDDDLIWSGDLRYSLPYPNLDGQMVSLLQADGQDDIARMVNQGDPADPFPGLNNVRATGPYSDYDGVFFKPSTNLPFLGDTNIWIENISDPSDLMTLDIRFLPNLMLSPVSAIGTLPTRPPIVFSNGTRRTLYGPGDEFNYDLSILNMDDNFPIAFFCEDSGPFSLDFWFSRFVSLTLNTNPVPSLRYDPGLAGNTFVIENNSVQLGNIPDGSYSMLVLIDQVNEVRESGELDNRFALPKQNVLFVNGDSELDLEIRNFTFGPQWLRKGEAAQIGGQVVNDSPVAAGPFWVEIWGSFDSEGKPAPTLDFMVTDSILIDSLAPGAAVDLSAYSMTVKQIPAHEMLQTFQVGGVVNRVKNVPEDDDTNNFQFVGPVLFSTLPGDPEAVVLEAAAQLEAEASPITVPRPEIPPRRAQLEQAELTVWASTVTLSGLPAPNDLQVNVTVRNWGFVPAGGSWTHVYLSTDPVYSVDDYPWITGLRTPIIPPQRDHTFAVPTAAPPLPMGTYYMIAQCDVIDDVPEDYENNNLFYAGVVYVGPELAFEYVKVTPQSTTHYAPSGFNFTEPHTNLLIDVRLRNLGLLPAGTAWLEFIGSELGGLTLNEFLCNSEVVAGVGPLSTVDLHFTRPLSSLPDGRYTPTVVIDRPGMVDEVIETNNRLADPQKILQLRPIRPVDLKVTDFKFAPNPVMGGEYLKMSGSIVNSGTEHSGPFWIEFWASFSPTTLTPDFPICPAIRIDNLRPGQQQFIEPYLRSLSPGLPKGEFAVLCIADRGDSIMELDETNNFRVNRFIEFR
jgi:M6 family metalloprotease-like protein